MELRVGSGTPVENQPDTFTFTDSTTPIRAVAGPPADDNGRVYFPFDSTESFEWREFFVPGQPVVVTHDVRLSGTLDADGVPTSEWPGGTVDIPGRLTGCMSRESVMQVNIAECGRTLGQMIEARGCLPDCLADSKDTLDGYWIDVRWSARTVAIQDAPDGG
jgi:hypothetical protein